MMASIVVVSLAAVLPHLLGQSQSLQEQRVLAAIDAREERNRLACNAELVDQSRLPRAVPLSHETVLFISRVDGHSCFRYCRRLRCTHPRPGDPLAP